MKTENSCLFLSIVLLCALTVFFCACGEDDDPGSSPGQSQEADDDSVDDEDDDDSMDDDDNLDDDDDDDSNEPPEGELWLIGVDDVDPGIAFFVHYQNGEWSVTETAEPDRTLHSIAFCGDATLVAAGSRTLYEYDGADWIIDTSFTLPAGANLLSVMCDGDEKWAVGYRDISNRPFAARTTNGVWETTDTSELPSGELLDLVQTHPGVAATAEDLDGLDWAGYMAYFDETAGKWSAWNGTRAEPATMTGAAFEPQSGWGMACGITYDPPLHLPLFLNWDGAVWADAGTEALPTWGYVSGISIPSHGEAWSSIVISTGKPYYEYDATLFYFFTDGQWQERNDFEETIVHDIDFSQPGIGWTVGQDRVGEQGALIHYDNDLWSRPDVPDLRDDPWYFTELEIVPQPR